MPAGLKRYYGRGDLHFITFSCYRRLPLLKTAQARNLFVKELEKAREEMGFRLFGYVVMAGETGDRRGVICLTKLANSRQLLPFSRLPRVSFE